MLIITYFENINLINVVITNTIIKKNVGETPVGSYDSSFVNCIGDNISGPSGNDIVMLIDNLIIVTVGCQFQNIV